MVDCLVVICLARIYSSYIIILVKYALIGFERKQMRFLNSGHNFKRIFSRIIHHDYDIFDKINNMSLYIVMLYIFIIIWWCIF